MSTFVLLHSFRRYTQLQTTAASNSVKGEATEDILQVVTFVEFIPEPALDTHLPFVI